MKKSVAALFGAAVVSASMLVAPVAASAASGPQVQLQSPPSMRVDEQQPTTLTVSGVSQRDRIKIDWGDGAIQRATTQCTPKRASQYPLDCAVTFSHEYGDSAGYPLKVSNRKKVIFSSAITITARARPAIEPEGTAGDWKMTSGRARYAPCSTVKWYFDGSAATPQQAGAIEDARWALSALSEQTGLTFVETANPQESELDISMENLGSPGPAGLGGWTGGNGVVRINTQSTWANDEWGGSDIAKTKQWTEGRTTWTHVMPGRGWLFVHEIMHALGFGHVSHEEAGLEIMNPSIERGGFGEGDLAGLHTMYLNQPCEVQP